MTGGDGNGKKVKGIEGFCALSQNDKRDGDGKKVKGIEGFCACALLHAE
jgi:hypothetical protein